MPTILLRIASVVFALFAAGHTFGAMIKDPKGGGPLEEATLAAMRGYHADVMGSSRSYWDFYKGFGWDVTCALVLFSILCWQLSNIARSQPAIARQLVLTLFIISIPITVLSYTNFFLAPAIFSTAGTLLLGAALSYPALRETGRSVAR
jgi:hypothetical protein